MNSGEVSCWTIEGVVTTCSKGEVGMGDALNVIIYTWITCDETRWSVNSLEDEPHSVVKDS